MSKIFNCINVFLDVFSFHNLSHLSRNIFSPQILQFVQCYYLFSIFGIGTVVLHLTITNVRHISNPTIRYELLNNAVNKLNISKLPVGPFWCLVFTLSDAMVTIIWWNFIHGRVLVQGWTLMCFNYFPNNAYFRKVFIWMLALWRKGAVATSLKS